MGRTENTDIPAIETYSLTKRYATSADFALKNLTIRVNRGEVYGFLGPNGAGKSTAIRLLMNFLQPTAGGGKILGMDIMKDSVAIKHEIGYLSGDSTLYPKMTGKQLMDYMIDLHPGTEHNYVAKLTKLLKLDTSKKLGELSRGNRQKAAIVQAFMHKPDLLILDEPTSGLDPLMQEVFFSLVQEAKKRGAAIFVSSHIMSEVQKMCDRVGIIRDGKLVGEYNIEELASEVAQTFDISFTGPMPSKRELEKIPGLVYIGKTNNSISLHMNEKITPLLALLSRYDVSKIDTRTLDLEETFMHFYKDEEPSS